MSIRVNIDHISTVKYRADCFTDYARTDYHIRDNSVYPDWNGTQPAYQKAIAMSSSLLTNNIIEIGYSPHRNEVDTIPEIGLPIKNPVVCDRLLFSGCYSHHYSFTSHNRYEHDMFYETVTYANPAIVVGGRRRERYISGKYESYLEIRLDNYYSVNGMHIGIFPFYDFEPRMGIIMSGQRYVNGQYSVLNHGFRGYIYSPELYSAHHIILGAIRLLTYADILKIISDSTAILNTPLENILRGLQYGAVFTVLGSPAAAAKQSEYAIYGARYGHTQQYPEDDSWDLFDGQESPEVSQDFWDWELFYYLQKYIFVPFSSQDEFDAAYAANYKWDDATIQQIDQYIN